MIWYWRSQHRTKRQPSAHWAQNDELELPDLPVVGLGALPGWLEANPEPWEQEMIAVKGMFEPQGQVGFVN